MPLAELTHPVIASLDHPLSRKRQRGFENLHSCFHPLSGLPERGSASVASPG
jgi:hypothetical protein